MANLFLLPLLSFFLVLATPGHAVVSPAEVYWKTVLPNTPMPSVIKNHLHPTGSNYGETAYPIYYRAATAAELTDKLDASKFFLEKDLVPGAKMSPLFTSGARSGPPFLPRRVSDSIPFSSEKLPQILKRFSLKPGSVEAEATKVSLRECETPAIDGGRKLCATSLESMVEFATSVVGTHDVRAMSTGEVGEGQQYTVVSSKKIGSKLVACHTVRYPYAVFFCHNPSGLQGYMVEMVGAADGLPMSAVVVCHRDTSVWNLKSLPLHFLGVKPGGASVCHFTPRDHIIWAPAATKE